jgi:GPH family glycoside/pentoside/hexuronide:cation symporter
MPLPPRAACTTRRPPTQRSSIRARANFFGASRQAGRRATRRDRDRHLPLIAALVGLMPEPGTQTQFSILLADRFIVALLATAGFIVVTSMITDIVEETELRTGRRSEGLLIAADTFLQKVSAGMAILVPGVLLALVAFPQNAAPATLDPHVMRTLAFISLPLWFVLATLSTMVLSFYRIDRRTHEANLAELEARGSH